MLKKIALGALLTGLVAVLVVGAVNRTNAVSGDAAGETGRHGQGTAYVETEAQASGGGGRWNATQQEPPGWGSRWAQEGAAGQTWGGAGNGVPQADVLPGEWSTFQGTVISAADDLVEIQTAEGAVIPFEGQPLRFALAQGFSAQAGDAVSLSGFEEDGEFKIGVITHLDSDVTYTLRDTSGRPGWSRGRRG